MALLPDTASLQKQQDEALLTVQQMLASSNSKVDSYVTALQQAGTDSAKLAEVQKSAIDQTANATTVITAQQQNAELWSQNTANAIYEAAGGEIAQVAQMQRFKDLSEEQQILQDKKRQIMSEEPTGIWLLDQIVNSISSLDVDKESKLVAQQLDTTANLAAMSGQMQEGYARVNSLNKQMTTAETIAANNAKIRAAADEEKAKVGMQQIAFNSENLRAQMAAQNQKVSNVLSGVDVSMRMEDQKARRQSQVLEERRMELQAQQQELDVERMQMQREQYKAERELAPLKQQALKLELENAVAMAPKDRAFKLAQYKEYEDKIARTKAYEEDVVKSVRAAQMVLNVPMESPEIIIEKFNNPTSREKYYKLQEMGLDSSNIKFASTPYKAMETIAEFDTSGNMSGSYRSDILNNVMSAISSQAMADPNAPKNQAQYEPYVNTVTKGYMIEKSKNIAAGDSTNPYQAPPLPVLVEASPKVQNSPLYQKVLKPFALNETNPQRIAELAANGVKGKLITPEEAAQGITDIFSAAAIYNNTFMGGFSRIGFGEYEQGSYNTIIKFKPSFAGSLAAGLTKGIGGSNGLIGGALMFPVAGKTKAEVSPTFKPTNLMNYSDSLLVVTKLLASNLQEETPPTTQTPTQKKD